MAGCQEKFQNKPMFCAALMPGFDERLVIPAAFVENIIPEKIATIWDPLGKPWPFMIQGEIPDLYFREGWQKFARAFGLDIGYSLLFCYEGDMDFSVIVFDTNSCRKEYTDLDMQEDVQCKDAIEEDQCQDVVLRDTGVRKKIKMEIPDPEEYVGEGDENMKYERVAKMSGGANENNVERDVNDIENIVGRSIKNKRIKRVVQSPENEFTVTAKRITRESENEPLDKVIKHKKIKTENVDQKDYLKGVNVNKTFEKPGETPRKSLKENDINKEGKNPGKIVKKSHDYKRTNGDDKESENVAKEEDNLKQNNGEDQDLENAVGIDLKNKIVDNEILSSDDVGNDMCSIKGLTNFRVTLKPRNLEGYFYLYIPVKFKEEADISEKHELILKDPKGNFWQTDIIHSTKNRTLISRGWKEFCLNNELKPGDDCDFQFSNESKENKKIVQVQIFRKPKKERLAAIKVQRTCGINLTGKPSFWITLTPCSVKCFNIQIPNAFVAARKMSQKHQVTLRDQNGRLFTVTLGHSTRNRTLFSNGWKTFCIRNELKPGDVCEFTCESNMDEIETFQVRILKKPPNSRYEDSMDCISVKQNLNSNKRRTFS